MSTSSSEGLDIGAFPDILSKEYTECLVYGGRRVLDAAVETERDMPNKSIGLELDELSKKSLRRGEDNWDLGMG